MGVKLSMLVKSHTEVTSVCSHSSLRAMCHWCNCIWQNTIIWRRKTEFDNFILPLRYLVEEKKKKKIIDISEKVICCWQLQCHVAIHSETKFWGKVVNGHYDRQDLPFPQPAQWATRGKNVPGVNFHFNFHVDPEYIHTPYGRFLVLHPPSYPTNCRLAYSLLLKGWFPPLLPPSSKDFPMTFHGMDVFFSVKTDWK